MVHPSAVFFFEKLVDVAIRNRDRISLLWPILAAHLDCIFENASTFPVVLVERTVIGLLRLCIRLVHKEETVAEISQYLAKLKSLPTDVFGSVAEQMMSGIFLLIKGNTGFLLRRSLLDTIMGLLAISSIHPDAAKYAFDCVTIIASDFPIAPTAEDSISTSTLITNENFAEYVDLLISFAAAAKNIGSALAEDTRTSRPRNYKISRG